MKESIMKLLTSEHISNYQISKATGIAQTTLSDYATGKSKIGNMKLDHALKLYDYYKKYKDVVEMLELTDYQMELARPYRLWVLYGRWFCVNEVVVNRKVYEDDVIVYTIETTDYREIVKVGTAYKKALDAIEKYHDDNAEHIYKEVARFKTFDEAIAFVNEKFPVIDIEAELNKYYEDDDDDDEI